MQQDIAPETDQIESPELAVGPSRPARHRPAKPGLRLNLRAFSGISVDTVLIIVLALLPALFFWRLFTPFQPDLLSLARGDFSDIHYPTQWFIAMSQAAGDLPYWNPYVVAGHSALGDIQFQVFYPLARLMRDMAGPAMPVQALEGLVAVHFALAGIFTYLFARKLVAGRLGPFLAALAFTYGGYLTSFPVDQTIILETSVWLPLVLLLLEFAIHDKRYECFALAAMASAIAVLAGHPQTAGYVAVGAAAYGLFRLWDVGFSWRSLLGLVAVPVLAVAMAAIQLLPSYQHLQLTARTGVDFAFVSTGYSAKELMGVLFPTRLGGLALYVGLLPVTLAVIALLNGHRQRIRLFWALLALAALVLAFGANTFLQPTLYATVPFLKFFRNHERTAFLFSLAVAMLAAYGASDLLRLDGERIRGLAKDALRFVSWATIVAGALAMILLIVSYLAPDNARPIMANLSDRAFFSVLVLIGILGLLALVNRTNTSRYLIALLMIGIVFVDLFSTNWQNNLQTAKPYELFKPTPIVQIIQASLGDQPFRISSEGLLPGGGNAGVLFGLQDLVGNTPLETEAYQTFDKGISEWRRWQLLNVRYVVTKRKLDHPALSLVFNEGDVNLYEIAKRYRLPRAYVVTSAVIATSDKEAVEKTNSIEPLNTVVLRSEPTIQLPSHQAEPSKANVTITDYHNTLIQADVSTPENGILVFSEVAYPGWEAEVDGQKVDLLTADGLLRAVPVTTGDHHVQLIYRPSALGTGATISQCALGIACVAFFGPLVYGILRRRRK